MQLILSREALEAMHVHRMKLCATREDYASVVHHARTVNCHWLHFLFVFLSEVSNCSDGVRVIRSCIRGSAWTLCAQKQFPIVHIPPPFVPESDSGKVLACSLVKTYASFFGPPDGFP